MERLHICAMGVAKTFDQYVWLLTTELISDVFGPVGNFSIKFCERFEKKIKVVSNGIVWTS